MTALIPQELIRAKRDGGPLADEEIAAFVEGLTDGSVSEGQAAAFAMAVFFQGLAEAECVALTRAMTDSGRRLAWPDLGRPLLDKHSTGGVGDKVSLVLAPLVAACGGCVPMISGRGLGHTGGTLDKLEAIPGYSTAPDVATFQRVVAEAGCAIIGQTDDLAPADRRLYAVRDVTATVESIPLITASILSKKLAAGLDALVMDVKCGSGAFMESLERSQALARSIVGVARGAGLPARALITDMSQVLGSTAGNALEVSEAIACLTAAGAEPRLRRVTLALAAELLVMGGLAADAAAAEARLAAALADGGAAEAFQRMVAALGGPADLLERPGHHLQRAPHVVPALPETPGRVAAIDVRAVGMAVVRLGGGRTRPDAAIDPAVGLAEVAGIGTAVDAERPLALVHARSRDAAAATAEALGDAFRITAEAAVPGDVVRELIVRE